MLIYLFKIIIIFPVLFFFIIRPINESLLENYLIPYLNNLFINRSEISFDFKTDNLIFTINDSNYFYSLPYNEYYIMFFVIFFSKIFSMKFLHFHILNFILIIFTPFFYFCISFQIDEAFTLLSVVQGTVNFYFLITIILNFLTRFGPKSFRFKIIN